MEQPPLNFVVGAHREAFAAVANKHLAAVVAQLLAAEGIQDVATWCPLITQMGQQAAQALSPSAMAAHGVSDPRHYIKVGTAVCRFLQGLLHPCTPLPAGPGRRGCRAPLVWLLPAAASTAVQHAEKLLACLSDPRPQLPQLEAHGQHAAAEAAYASPHHCRSSCGLADQATAEHCMLFISLTLPLSSWLVVNACLIPCLAAGLSCR